ncbi:MAG: sensor histidine kinase [Gammaproteobacteria bacterium]|nr:sensor histidine kinase [Gammaproteobacteria bacterium]
MSLRFHLNLLITLLFLLALLLALFLAINNTRRAVQDELHSTVALTVQLLGETIAALEPHGNPRARARLVERIDALENIRHLCIGLYGEKGAPPVQSRGCAGARTATAPGWFRNLLARQKLEFRRSITLDSPPHSQLVVYADPADEISEAWQDTSDLLILMVGFWLAANLVVFVTLGAAMRPIDTILKGLDGIERGHYRLRLPVFRLPEFARISASFNHMAGALEKSTAENRYLTQKSLAIQEEERRLMARELHDELGQCLSAVQADAVSISKWSRGGVAPQVHESAQAIVSVSSRVFEVIRSMIKRLRPATLDELGLVITLGQTIDDWNTRHPEQFCRLQHRGEVDLNSLDDTVSIHVYRIVQECLTNIERHARAEQLSVEIETSARAGELRLRVTDDGCGFETRATRTGLGLIGMRERASVLGGAFEIETAPGEGTRVVVCLPLRPVWEQAPRPA